MIRWKWIMNWKECGRKRSWRYLNLHLFWTWKWIFRCHKKWRFLRILLASQEGLPHGISSLTLVQKMAQLETAALTHSEECRLLGCGAASVHTRSTRRHIPEDGILHSHRRENLKSYELILLLFIKSSHTGRYVVKQRWIQLFISSMNVALG
jgi:hypothetical protein